LGRLIVFEIDGIFRFDHSLKHIINDGLVAIFFFVIGLEVKREVVLGELQSIRSAALPLAGALGGMLVPAGLYVVLQLNQPGIRGWGIPMATDIAFVVGCMALIGSRMPNSLRVMLLSLAIVDDIGAILVIALSYTDPNNLSMAWLACGFALLVVVFVLGRVGVRNIGVYTMIGFFSWLAFHESGVHATIAGVLLGLLTQPFEGVELEVSSCE
jgi:NhaA family Na+:H+ antiporter